MKKILLLMALASSFNFGARAQNIKIVNTTNTDLQVRICGTNGSTCVDFISVLFIVPCGSAPQYSMFPCSGCTVPTWDGMTFPTSGASYTILKFEDLCPDSKAVGDGTCFASPVTITVTCSGTSPCGSYPTSITGTWYANTPNPGDVEVDF